MMKLIIFGLLCIILAVHTKSYEWQLIEEGDPFTYMCDKPSAKWTLHRMTVAYCKDCPSIPCTVEKEYHAGITAFCNKTHPVFHYYSTPVDMDYSLISCPAHKWEGIHLRVGRYDGRLHAENKSTLVALEQNNFTVVYDKRQDGPIDWYNKQGERLAAFYDDCTDVCSYYEKKRLNFTCDEKTSKLHINNVTLNDDGKLFACSESLYPSLFSLTVNVPVSSVSIQPQRQVLVENEESSFVCEVEGSKPEATFEWIIVYQNGLSQEIQQKYTTISKTLEGKLWQTNSTLEMRIRRDFQKIMCKATIHNLPWTNSEYLSLDIKVPVTSVYIQPQSQVLVENQDAIFICQVEESKPEASFEWIIVSQNGSSQEIHQDSTTISKRFNGNVWQTNSTLKLKLMRYYERIMCKATIENLPWTNSEYQSLDIKVPVTYVSIQPQTHVLVENQDATFMCQVEESNPEASFEWIILYHNGSSQEIHQDSTTITKIHKGNVWQTNSTLKLNPKRYYEKIICKATIENLPWTNSEYQSLDIKDTKIPTGATTIYCVIAVIIVSVIIIGGFLYLKHGRPSSQEDEIQIKYTKLME